MYLYHLTVCLYRISLKTTCCSFNEAQWLLNCKYSTEHICKLYPHHIQNNSYTFMLKFFTNTNNLVKIAKFTEHICYGLKSLCFLGCV